MRVLGVAYLGLLNTAEELAKRASVNILLQSPPVVGKAGMRWCAACAVRGLFPAARIDNGTQSQHACMAGEVHAQLTLICYGGAAERYEASRVGQLVGRIASLARHARARSSVPASKASEDADTCAHISSVRKGNKAHTHAPSDHSLTQSTDMLQVKS